MVIRPQPTQQPTATNQVGYTGGHAVCLQRLRSTQRRGARALSPCRIRVPHQIHIAGRNKIWKLRHVVGTHFFQRR